MKLLCILFAFVVVYLAVKPCCTDSDCDAIAKTEQAAKSKAKSCAGCSPFFSCGTCAGFTVTKPVSATLLFFAARAAQVYTPYQQPEVKEISSSIWQPPKLG
ncbi:hypothetical protein GWR56_14245 [Mucilaginibacter sp. 14171R-50]|uniref:hypothetical protein n=1 Tax=Mucilaginibacter sp. 14171R-50 TaxID=2703789 RepID=UPI00138B51CD|nr:hypothetical protein [Mucilaginibacter sp. 14171R-50]QHS56645.1 hypothetical protein GWR56_14245 [Mucilaginibacter sp. 14171R-50]